MYYKEQRQFEYSRTSMSYHQSKEQTFSSQTLTVGTSRKRPAPVSDHVHFLGLTVFFNLLLFLASCEQPLYLKFGL